MMKTLRMAGAAGVLGFLLTGCVETTGYSEGYVEEGYDPSISSGSVYIGGYNGYDGGRRYRYDDGYNRYPGRRWNDDNDYRGRDQDAQRRRPDRNANDSRPDRHTGDSRSNRQNDRPPSNNVYAPYSPNSCGQPDCTGLSTRGSNR